MILPIVAYGDTVLRKVGSNITKDYPNLPLLIENMWETMYHANGVGLAAPQIGKSINLFLVDTTMFEDENVQKFKGVFINTEIYEEWGDKWEYEEGCLSIPHIRENVKRHPKLRVKFLDENFEEHDEEFGGVVARVIQHEFDHCKGILFVDYLTELKKRLIKNKLINISKGGARTDYKMRIPVLR